MANPEKTKADTQEPHRIASDEHLIGKNLIGRRPKIQSLNMPLAPTVPTATPQQKWQNTRSIQMGSPLISSVILLKQNLDSWQPKIEPQAKLKTNLGRELSLLGDILFQQSIEKEIEDKDAATNCLLADPTLATAPSPERIREELASLSAVDPLPLPLAAALRVFTEEYDRCFPADHPEHPLCHKHAPTDAPTEV